MTNLAFKNDSLNGIEWQGPNEPLILPLEPTRSLPEELFQHAGAPRSRAEAIVFHPDSAIWPMMRLSVGHPYGVLVMAMDAVEAVDNELKKGAENVVFDEQMRDRTVQRPTARERPFPPSDDVKANSNLRLHVDNVSQCRCTSNRCLASSPSLTTTSTWN